MLMFLVNSISISSGNTGFSSVPGAVLGMNEVCNQYHIWKEHFMKPYELLIFNLFFDPIIWEFHVVPSTNNK